MAARIKYNNHGASLNFDRHPPRSLGRAWPKTQRMRKECSKPKNTSPPHGLTENSLTQKGETNGEKLGETDHKPTAIGNLLGVLILVFRLLDLWGIKSIQPSQTRWLSFLPNTPLCVFLLLFLGESTCTILPGNHSTEGIGPFASEALVYQDEDTLLQSQTISSFAST